MPRSTWTISFLVGGYTRCASRSAAPNGMLAGTGSNDGTVRLCDAGSGKELRQYRRAAPIRPLWATATEKPTTIFGSDTGVKGCH